MSSIYTVQNLKTTKTAVVSSTTNTCSIISSPSASMVTQIVLPTNNGSNLNFLKTDGSGNTSWDIPLYDDGNTVADTQSPTTANEETNITFTTSFPSTPTVLASVLSTSTEISERLIGGNIKNITTTGFTYVSKMDTSTDVSIGSYTTGNNFSVVTLDNGNIGIAFYDTSDTKLKFARTSTTDGSGNWTVYNPDTTAGRGELCTCFISSISRPCIFYRGTGSVDVMFAICSTVDGTGSWTISTVATVVSALIDVVSSVTPSGLPAVLYNDTNTLTLKFSVNANNDGSGAWTTTNVNPSTAATFGSYVSLTYSFFTNVPIACYSADSGTSVVYARNANSSGTGAWTRTTVYSANPLSTYTSLVVNSDTFPMIAFRNDTVGDTLLYKSTNSAGSAWSAIGTFPSNDGINGNIFLSSYSNPAVIYYDNSTSELKFTICSTTTGTGSWTTKTFKSVGLSRSSVILNRLGYILLVYWVSSNLRINNSGLQNSLLCDNTAYTVQWNAKI